MLHRRSLLGCATGAALAATLRPARADTAVQDATNFVKTTGDKLVGVVNGPGSAQEKRQRLTQIIDGDGGCGRRGEVLPGPVLAAGVAGAAAALHADRSIRCW